MGIKKQIDKKEYKICGYNKFIIKDPKVRTIQTLYYHDRVVQHCIVDNYLMPLLENRLIYDNGACRINKGTDFCIKRMRKFLIHYFHKFGNDGYVLQFDIHHYFESIKHDILIDKLNKIVKDKDVLDFLINIIHSYSDYDNSGLPIGNQTSQCFALYYLDAVDRIIKEKYKIKYYSRYMDDGVLLSNNKIQLKHILDDIRKTCNKLGISINEKKTRIYKICNGFTYLGYRFILLENGKIIMKIPNKKKTRIRRYIRKLNKNALQERLLCFKNYLSKENNNKFYNNLTIIYNKK